MINLIYPPAIYYQSQTTTTFYAVQINGLYLINVNLFYPSAFSTDPTKIPPALQFATNASAQAYVNAVQHRFTNATWSVVVVSY